MKIIATDNLNRDNVSDFLVCENINEVYGQQFVDLYNKQYAEHTGKFLMLVPDDHKLYVWEP